MQQRTNNEDSLMNRLESNFSTEAVLASNLLLLIISTQILISFANDYFSNNPEKIKHSLFDLVPALNLEFLISRSFINRSTSYITNRFRVWHNNQIANITNKLDNQFSELTQDERLQLVTQGLADIDSANKVTPKFMCPITTCITVKPVIVKVRLNNSLVKSELYDKHSIAEWLARNRQNRNFVSPLSQLSFECDAAGNVIIENYPDRLEFETYLSQLSTAMDTIELARTRHSQSWPRLGWNEV